jgi:hypothetical protein
VWPEPLHQSSLTIQYGTMWGTSEFLSTGRSQSCIWVAKNVALHTESVVRSRATRRVWVKIEQFILTRVARRRRTAASRRG